MSTVNRGKVRASQSQVVSVLLLTGWESGSSFANQSWSVVKQNQSKNEINLGTQLKSALMELVSIVCEEQLRVDRGLALLRTVIGWQNSSQLSTNEKQNQNQSWLARTRFPPLFPRLGLVVTCICFKFWLAHCTICVCCDWPDQLFWFWFHGVVENNYTEILQVTRGVILPL